MRQFKKYNSLTFQENPNKIQRSKILLKDLKIGEVCRLIEDDRILMRLMTRNKLEFIVMNMQTSRVWEIKEVERLMLSEIKLLDITCIIREIE